MTRPQDLTPTQYTALLLVINPANWEPGRYGQQSMSGSNLAHRLGYRTPKYAYDILKILIKKGYLNTDLKPTKQCDGMSKSLTMKGT